VRIALSSNYSYLEYIRILETMLLVHCFLSLLLLAISSVSATCYAPDGVSTASADFLPCINIAGVDSSEFYSPCLSKRATYEEVVSVLWHQSNDKLGRMSTEWPLQKCGGQRRFSRLLHRQDMDESKLSSENDVWRSCAYFTLRPDKSLGMHSLKSAPLPLSKDVSQSNRQINRKEVPMVASLK